MIAHFHMAGEVIVIMARAESDMPDGPIGDMIVDIAAGEDFYGVSYDQLKERGGGRIEVGEDGIGKLLD